MNMLRYMHTVLTYRGKEEIEMHLYARVLQHPTYIDK